MSLKIYFFKQFYFLKNLNYLREGSGGNMGCEWYQPTTLIPNFWIDSLTSNSDWGSISTDTKSEPVDRLLHGNASLIVRTKKIKKLLYKNHLYFFHPKFPLKIQ